MNAYSMVWLLLLWSFGTTALAQDRGELVDAIRRVRMDEIKNLLAQGANPNACAPDLYSPLMIAAEMAQLHFCWTRAPTSTEPAPGTSQP